MRQNLKNAAMILVVLFCAAMSVFFTACTNSEDGMPTFSASQKTIEVIIEKKDTIWYPVHDTLTVEVIKRKASKLTAIQSSTSKMKNTTLHTIPSLKMV